MFLTNLISANGGILPKDVLAKQILNVQLGQIFDFFFLDYVFIRDVR